LGLCLDDTNRAKNDQQNAKYKKPAPGFPDLIEASSEEIGNSGHCLFFSFGHRSARAVEITLSTSPGMQ
jgi:hypothetical protein